MATEAQVLANRSNAKKSTGPRTAEGKAVVSQNAVKHGLCGRETVVVGEDPGEFEFYRERRLAELDPVGEVEADLAERIVDLSWRLRRAGRLQATAFDSLYARQVHSPMEPYDRAQDADGGSVLGRALVRDFSDCRVLDRLLMYERRIEHSLYRTMAELKRHRILQEVGPGGMWELRRALASEDGKEVVRGRTTYEEPPVNGPAGTLERGSGRGNVDRENHGRDARATKTLPDPSCQTKPIPPSHDPVQTASSKELTADSSSEASAKTKPIHTTAEGPGDDPLLQTSGVPHPPSHPLCQANRLASNRREGIIEPFRTRLSLGFLH